MKTRLSSAARGFSLVEVTLALGVAGFCLVAIFGLLPVALNSNQAAIQQTAAESVLTAVVSDLRATPPTSPLGGAATSGQYAISIPAAGSAATLQPLYFAGEQQLTSTVSSALYRVTISFLATPSGGTQSATTPSGVTRSATIVSIMVSWPAVVDPTKATPNGVVQTFTAMDRN